MSDEAPAPGVIKSIFTETDNATWCPVRIFGIGFAILCSNLYLVLAYYTVIHLKTAFDYKAYGEGLSILWTVVSAAIAGKAYVEKRPDQSGN